MRYRILVIVVLVVVVSIGLIAIVNPKRSQAAVEFSEKHGIKTTTAERGLISGEHYKTR